MKLSRLSSLIAAVAVATLLIVAPVMAIALPDSPPTVSDINVYRNVLETGDRLLVAYFNIPYAVTPADPASKTFVWQLVDNVTVLGSASGYSYVDSGYGYQAMSMYFAAADNWTWDPATPYTLRLQGTPSFFAGTIPVYNYTVSSASYSTLTATADVKLALALDVILICEDLDAAWGLTDSLLYEDDAGTVLSSFGQAYWRGTIPAIQSMAPTLFPLAIRTIPNEDRTFTDNYSTALAGQYAGTWVATARAAGTALFGTTFNLLDLIIVLASVIALVVANIYLTNDAWNGLVDAALLLLIFTRLSMFEMGYLMLIGAVAIMYIGMGIIQKIPR